MLPMHVARQSRQSVGIKQPGAGLRHQFSFVGEPNRPIGVKHEWLDLALQRRNRGGARGRPELQPEYAPHLPTAPRESTYAIGADEFQKFLLPATCEEVEARMANSTFVHLWNEMWRKAGVPKNIAPPRGCWLDRMFERHQIPIVWSDRLDAAYVERWAALRRDRDHAGHYNLVHDRELTRLRAELDARQELSQLSGIDRIINGLKRRLGRSHEG